MEKITNYKLRYTFNSVCAIEEISGAPLDRLMDKVFSSVRLLFWGALIDQQPDITIEEVGDLIGDHIKGGGKLNDIAEMCSEALSLAGFLSEE